MMGLLQLFIVMLLLGMMPSSWAAPAFLKVSRAPPPQFQQIAKPQKIEVSVKYQGNYLGRYAAIVSPTKIRFIPIEKRITVNLTTHET